MAEQEPKAKATVQDRKNALGYLGTGAGLVAAGEGGNYLMGRHLKRMQAKGGMSTPKAIMRRKVKPVHVARTAGKVATRVSTGVGIPLAAYGAWNAIHPKDKVKPVNLRRDVLEPAGRKATYRNEAEAVAAKLREVADSVDKRLSDDEQERLHRHKNAGRNLSLAGGTIGVTALALRSPEAARGLLKVKGLKDSKRLARVANKEPGATKASNTLLAIGAGLGSAGAFNYAAQQKLENKALEKAEGEYFRRPKPLERDAGQGRRLRTEVEHQAWRAGAAGLAGASTAAVGARWLGHRRAPEAIAAASRAARAKGVPKETVDINRARLERVGRWASNKRGRLLAASVGLGGAATATGAVSRWKRDESQGISQDLGRSGAGKDYIKKSGSMAAGIELGQLAARRLEKMPLASRQVLYRSAAIGGGSALGAAAVTGTVKRQRRVRREKRELAAGLPLSKSDPVTVALRREKADAAGPDRFLRRYSDRISPRAESGYQYLREGRNERRRAAASLGVVTAGGAAGTGLATRAALRSTGASRAGYTGLAALGALSSGVTGVASVNHVRSSRRWESKMAKIRAKAKEREAAGEYGRDRVVTKAEPKKDDNRKRNAAIAAGAVGGGAAVAFTPLPHRLPDDEGASQRIRSQLKGASEGTLPLKDVRAVATGSGSRLHGDTYTARMARDRRKGEVRLMQTADGNLRIADGHHLTESMEMRGEDRVKVKVQQSSARRQRAWVPLASRAKFDADVRAARRPTPRLSEEEINRRAGRPIPKWARQTNKVKAKAEAGVIAAMKPRNAAGLAALGGLTAGGLVARKKHQETKEPVRKDEMTPEERKAAKQAAWEAKQAAQNSPEAIAARERAQAAGAAEKRRAEQAAAKTQTAAANTAAAEAKIKRRTFRPSNSQAAKWTAGIALAGAGLAALKSRDDKRERREEPKGGRKADAAIGAVAGLGARDAAMGVSGWGAKRGIEAYRERKLRDPEAKARYNQDWKAFQEREGFKQFGAKHPGDKLDMTNHRNQVKVGMRYPTSIPGGRAARLLALKNSAPVSIGTRVGAPVLGALVAANAGGKQVEKGLFPVRPSHLRLRSPKMYLPKAAGSSARMKAPRVGHLRRLPGGSQVTVRGTTR